jgi:putative membrane fusion protein
MKTIIPKRTRKIIACYLAALIILYVVIYVVPKVTDLFETTQVLENGTLIISCEAEGYLVKDETINIAGKTGTIKYNVEEGTVIKKGTDVVDITEVPEDADKDIRLKYNGDLEKLAGYDGVEVGGNSPISGVLSFTIDGNEPYFNTKNLKKITQDGAKDHSGGTTNLKRQNAVKGEPVFKVSSDDKWYMVCWMDKEDAKAFEAGTAVRLELPEGKVNATIQSVKKEDGDYKVVIYSNGYYKAFAETREADVTIVKSNNTGLICDNECIIEVDGVEGVYVVDKNGDYKFKPINVLVTDGKQSVLSEKTFTNDKYELVETVIVHDEVLRNPQKALEKEEK